MITKTVLPEKVKMDVLRQYDVGKEAYTTFVNERILGTVNLWAPMSKIKLQKWSSTAKCLRTKVGSQIVELKGNRSVFARMAIAAKYRPEINMEEAISKYELSGVSRSLFAADGSLLPCNDKSKLMHILEDLSATNNNVADNLATQQVPIPLNTNNKTLIVDGMVLGMATLCETG
jgi:hypothetical protein